MTFSVRYRGQKNPTAEGQIGSFALLLAKERTRLIYRTKTFCNFANV